MAIQHGMKLPVSSDVVFTSGVLCLGVEAAIDFDRRGQADDQERDKETGERLWLIKCLDLDPEAGKFGGSKEFKVKIAARVQPVPPSSPIPGYPPQVEFIGLTISPYVDSSRRKPAEPGKAHKCKARLAWSYRAEAMTEPQSAGKSRAAA